jgi:predicted aldo/keto reductase-like oxidoreductase
MMSSKDESGISRRRFVRQSGLLAAGAALGAGTGAAVGEDDGPGSGPSSPSEFPRAVLGRTGESVTRMTLGTVPSGMPKSATPKDVARMVSAALDAGIRSIDVAPAYINAEEGAGMALGSRRKEVFLSTKVQADTVEAAEASFANSLRLLNTECVDVLYLHSVGSRAQDRDPDVALRPDGVFPWILKQKKLGKCRFAGVSSHNAPSMCRQMLETGDVDVLLTVINFVDRYTYNHEGKLIPVARKHGTGVIAMKVFGGVRRLLPPGVERNMAGPAEMEGQDFSLAIRYALNVPGVTAVNLGCHTPEQIRQNVATVNTCRPLSDAERKLLERIGRQLAPEWRERFGPAERPKKGQNA